jgi:hypothetical protein
MIGYDRMVDVMLKDEMVNVMLKDETMGCNTEEGGVLLKVGW